MLPSYHSSGSERRQSTQSRYLILKVFSQSYLSFSDDLAGRSFFVKLLCCPSQASRQPWRTGPDGKHLSTAARIALCSERAVKCHVLQMPCLRWVVRSFGCSDRNSAARFEAACKCPRSSEHAAPKGANFPADIRGPPTSASHLSPTHCLTSMARLDKVTSPVKSFSREPKALMSQHVGN
jgi:hypothetical protein